MAKIDSFIILDRRMSKIMYFRSRYLTFTGHFVKIFCLCLSFFCNADREGSLSSAHCLENLSKSEVS